MDDSLDVRPGLSIPLREFSFTFVRSSGPGGQNVNKVNSKAVLRWPIKTSPSLPADVRARFVAHYRRRIGRDGHLLLTSQRYRDQARNVDDCLEKLRDMLRAVADRPVRRRPMRPTRASKERRIEDKKRQGRKKQLRRDRPTDE